MGNNAQRGEDLRERIRRANAKVFDGQRHLRELEEILDADYRTLAALQQQYEDWRVAQRAAVRR